MGIDLSAFDRFAVQYQKGEIIFCEFEPGDTFYLIRTGDVEIVKILGGVEKMLDVLKPGEFFGEMALLEEAPRTASAIAHEDTTLLEFNRANFEILLKGNPQIAINLLKIFSRRSFDQKRRFKILTLKDDQARIADVFLMLRESCNCENADDMSCTFNTTAEDIAHWAAMTPAKCKDILKLFNHQRRIDLFKDKIIVKNMKEFERFVTTARKRQAEPS